MCVPVRTHSSEGRNKSKIRKKKKMDKLPLCSDDHLSKRKDDERDEATVLDEKKISISSQQARLVKKEPDDRDDDDDYTDDSDIDEIGGEDLTKNKTDDKSDDPTTDLSPPSGDGRKTPSIAMSRNDDDHKCTPLSGVRVSGSGKGIDDLAECMEKVLKEKHGKNVVLIWSDTSDIMSESGLIGYVEEVIESELTVAKKESEKDEPVDETDGGGGLLDMVTVDNIIDALTNVALHGVHYFFMNFKKKVREKIKEFGFSRISKAKHMIAYQVGKKIVAKNGGRNEHTG